MEINYRGIPMLVEYDYQPEEAQTLHHPPIQEQVDLCSCVVGGEEITDLLSDKAVEGIECEVLRKINEEE